MASWPAAKRRLLETGRRPIGKACKTSGILLRLARSVTNTAGPPRVWLTFDDGPDPYCTPKILEALNARRIRATFFVIGRQAEQHASILDAAVAAGHRIGNHSLTHPYLTLLDEASIRTELATADALLHPYMQGRIFRPPHGARDHRVDAIAHDLGYETVLWNASARDFHPRLQPDGWVELGLRMVRLGGDAIVLLHDVYAGTADHMPRFLDALCGIDDVTFMSPESLPRSM